MFIVRSISKIVNFEIISAAHYADCPCSNKLCGHPRPCPENLIVLEIKTNKQTLSAANVFPGASLSGAACGPPMYMCTSSIDVV
jgi:hypothetical protein